jgi:hypothetical protein
MIDENRYEWEVYYNGVLLGRTTTEGRFQLVKEKIAAVSIPLIEFRVVLKQHFGVEDHAVPILSADEQALFAGIASSKLFTIAGAKKQFGVEE